VCARGTINMLSSSVGGFIIPGPMVWELWDLIILIIENSIK